jgi:hypothetical protein
MGRHSPSVSRCGILTGLFGITEMNERIFELAKQADLIQWDTLSSGAKTPDHESVVKAKKFAELIVRECQTVVEWAISVDSTIDRVPMLIKEHFGVEE